MCVAHGLQRRMPCVSKGHKPRRTKSLGHPQTAAYCIANMLHSKHWLSNSCHQEACFNRHVLIGMEDEAKVLVALPPFHTCAVPKHFCSSCFIFLWLNLLIHSFITFRVVGPIMTIWPVVWEKTKKQTKFTVLGISWGQQTRVQFNEVTLTNAIHYGTALNMHVKVHMYNLA